jgi:uncharacterized protein YybS (DUF2232 family)
MPILLLLAAGLASAVLHLSVTTGPDGLFLLGYLASLPLFLAGLSLGATAAAACGIVGATSVAVVVGLVAGVLYFFAYAVPVAILTRQALLNRADAEGRTEWYPSGRLLLWLSALAIAAVAIAFGVGAMVSETGLIGALRAALEPIYREMAAAGLLAVPQGADPQTLQDFFTASITIVPGVVALIWALTLLGNGALAQRILTRAERAVRPGGSFGLPTLPHVAAFGFALLSLAAAFLSSPYGMLAGNLALAACLPFLITGFGVVHALAHTTRFPTPLLVGFYLIAAITFWPLMLVVALGVFDVFQEVRLRMQRRSAKGV